MVEYYCGDYRSTKTSRTLPHEKYFWNIIDENNEKDLFQYTFLTLIEGLSPEEMERCTYAMRWTVYPHKNKAGDIIKFIIDFDEHKISLKNKVKGYYSGVSALNLYPSWDDIQLLKPSHKLLNL